MFNLNIGFQLKIRKTTFMRFSLYSRNICLLIDLENETRHKVTTMQNCSEKMGFLQCIFLYCKDITFHRAMEISCMLHNYIPNPMDILLSRFLMKIAVVVILNLFQTVSYSGLSFHMVI